MTVNPVVRELLEIHAVHKLHHHEMLTADKAEMVGLNDVRVDEVRDQPGLADEILLELLDARILLPNQLDGD